MIATSINLHVRTHAVLACAAIRLGTSRREVVVRALMKVMSNVVSFQGGFAAVRYQSDSVGINWRCFAIKLRPDEYEFFTDLRKICKCSVSLLVSVALEKFLDELLDESVNEVYNNTPFINYIFKRMIISGVLCWMRWWGYPKDEKSPLLE